MTMHLEGPWLTTTSTRKRSIRMTKANVARWQQELVEKNRKLKSLGLPRLTLEQYIDEVHGRGQRIKSTWQPLAPRQDLHAERMRENRERYPSLNSTGGSTARAEPKVYTGTLIKGIATMHKSNAVPVINDEQAREISQMRRG